MIVNMNSDSGNEPPESIHPDDFRTILARFTTCKWPVREAACMPRESGI